MFCNSLLVFAYNPPFLIFFINLLSPLVRFFIRFAMLDSSLGPCASIFPLNFLPFSTLLIKFLYSCLKSEYSWMQSSPPHLFFLSLLSNNWLGNLYTVFRLSFLPYNYFGPFFENLFKKLFPTMNLGNCKISFYFLAFPIILRIPPERCPPRVRLCLVSRKGIWSSYTICYLDLGRAGPQGGRS